MKKFCLTVLFIFITSILGFAQAPAAESWKVITPYAEEFSVDVPASIDGTGFDEKNENGSRRYQAVLNGKYFFIFSDAGDKPDQWNEVLRFVKQFQAGAAFPAGAFQSDQFRFTDGDGYYYTILAVKTQNRAYIFQTAGTSQNDPEIERFFESVKFKKPASAAQSEPSAAAKNNAGASSGTSSTGGSGIGSGSGMGNGIGSGSGTGNGTGLAPPSDSQSPQNQTAPLKILSKPPANFTEFASFYRVTGSIRVKVVFKATGEIGEVSPISGLPFGLMSQALNAARSIKFTPAMKDGKPYEVAKIVEYSFTIY